MRGWSRDAYEAALGELVDRGWAARDGETFGITEVGRTVRDRAEAQTDAFFYAPWSALSESEIADLGGLLACIRDTLAPPLG